MSNINDGEFGTPLEHRATPKPRAGEDAFDIPKHMERNRLDAYDALLAERDLLRERERELVEVLEMMLDIDPVLQAPSDYQIAKARTALAKVRP